LLIAYQQTFQFLNKRIAKICTVQPRYYLQFTVTAIEQGIENENLTDNQGFHVGFPNKTVQQWISQCENSSYFYEQDKLHWFFNDSLWSLKGEKIYSKRKLYFGKPDETIMEYTMIAYTESFDGNEILLNYFMNRLYHVTISGIYAQWEYFAERKKFVMCKHCDDAFPKAVDLYNSNINTIFYILLTGLSISIITYITETVIFMYTLRLW